MKKLEQKIPELQAKLRKHMKQAPARAGSSGADGLTRRVEVLEDAVDTLLDAEVREHAFLCALFTTQIAAFREFCLVVPHVLVMMQSALCGLGFTACLQMT